MIKAWACNSSPVIAIQAAVLHGFGDMLGGNTAAESPRSAMVRATLRMRSCARAERPIRRTAISSVRSPASSSAQTLRISRAGMRAL